MPFIPGLFEKIAASLAVDLIRASAGKVRRLLSASETQKALQTAIATALERTLATQDLEQLLQDHYSTVFEEFFRREAVVYELSQLLDPRPGVELDFDVLAREFEEAGGDAELIEHFDLGTFLRTFASELYAAAAGEEALQGKLEIKLLGEMVKRMGSVAHATERTATATERMTLLLQRFLDDRATEPALLQAGREARAQGVLAAFQAFEGIAAAMFKAGFDFGVGRSGAIEIGGDLKALPPAQAETIRTLAGELRQSVIETDPSPAELDALEERYRQHVIRWFESLQFQGLVRTPRPILLPLDEVYVELRAVAEVPEAADAFSVEERRLLLELDEKDHSGRRELMSQLDALRRERWSRTLPERKSIAETLHQRDRRAFVLLGDPGSGKTTLLHFLALVYARGPAVAAERLKVDPVEADRLPIFVPLAAFDDMLRESGREGRSLTLLEFLPRYYDRRRGLPGLEPLFRRALASGRALVLLDGLDEVLDVGTRTYVAQQAGALIGEWSPRGVRFAVSSRFVGYREAPVPGNLPTLSVLDFGPPEIELFVHRWAHAYEKWAAQGVESPEMLRAARQLEADLLVDVRSNESVRRLAANPLMLTMLALLRRQVGKLPHRRVQLYESYAGALLETWIDARNPGAREKSVEILDRHHAENLLLPLALWLQKEKPSGTAGGAELRGKLTEICLAESGLKPETANLPQRREAEERADRFLREMRQMTGLLVERGHDAYGFLHLTFQEYFAGRALASLGDPERWEMVRPHLHDSRWREPILLCAGRLGVVENRRPQVTAFVRSILEHEDPTEEKLHRNLLLALAIAGDDVNLDPLLISQLVDKAATCLPTWVYAIARDVAGALGQLVANGAAGTASFHKIWESEDWQLRHAVVEKLGQFADVESIHTMLLERINDKATFVAASALGALSSQVIASQAVRQAIMNQLDNPHIGVHAATALSGAASLDSQIRTMLLEKAKRRDWSARYAIVALSSLIATDEEVRNTIFLQLVDSHSEARGPAIKALARLIETDAAVAKAIEALLEHSVEADPEAWGTALEVLSTVPERQSAARQAAFEHLNNPSPYVRVLAIEALASLGIDEEVRESLLRKLHAGTAEEKSAATKVLAGLLPYDPQVLCAIQNQVQALEWPVRKSIAEAIGSNPGVRDSIKVLSCIYENLEAEESFVVLEEVATSAPNYLDGNQQWRSYWLIKSTGYHPLERAAGIFALARAAGKHVKFRPIFLQGLKDSDPEVRSATLRAIVGIIATDSKLRRAALRALDDEDEDVQSAAFKVLASLADSDLETRDTLIRRVEERQNFGWDQYSGLSDLRGVVKIDERARNAVLKILNNQGADAKAAAILALAASVDSDPRVRRALLEEIDGESWASSAALSALSGWVGIDTEIRDVVLHRLEDEEFQLGFASLEALSDIARADSRFRNALLGRLTGKSDLGRWSALPALIGLIGTDVEIREAILRRMEDSDFSVRLAAVIGIAKSSQELLSPALLGQLRPWLSFDVGSFGAHSVRVYLARLFGSQISVDHALRNELLGELQARRWSTRAGAILSLLAWPGGPPGDVLGQILEALEDRRGLESYSAQLAAASFLINRNEYTQTSIALCLEALDYGTQTWESIPGSEGVRRQAAVVLGKLEPVFFERRIYDRLLTVMENDEEPDVRDAAYRVLVRLAGTTSVDARRSEESNVKTEVFRRKGEP